MSTITFPKPYFLLLNVTPSIPDKPHNFSCCPFKADFPYSTLDLWVSHDCLMYNYITSCLPVCQSLLCVCFNHCSVSWEVIKLSRSIRVAMPKIICLFSTFPSLPSGETSKDIKINPKTKDFIHNLCSAQFLSFPPFRSS